MHEHQRENGTRSIGALQQGRRSRRRARPGGVLATCPPLPTGALRARQSRIPRPLRAMMCRMARVLRIELTFLADLQKVAGRETIWLDVGAGATVARALAVLRERYPEFAGVDMIANVNGVAAGPERPLAQGDGLFLLPRT
jgi:molybdopterin converting factor small subunit